MTTEHEPTHAHEADAASDTGGVDGETADDGADDVAGETADAAASGVLGLSDDEEREYAQDYALTER